jgi:hypothetical protein
VSASLSYKPQSNDSSRKTDLETKNKIDKKEKNNAEPASPDPLKMRYSPHQDPGIYTCRYANSEDIPI